jgi:hypothetical protein
VRYIALLQAGLSHAYTKESRNAAETTAKAILESRTSVGKCGSIRAYRSSLLARSDIELTSDSFRMPSARRNECAPTARPKYGAA